MSTVIGYKEFKTTLDRLVTNCTKGKWLDEACQFVEDDAKDRVPEHMGTLRESIKHKVTGKGQETLTGFIGTNMHYAGYVEFGTGPIGARKHNGISPNVPVAYSAEPWYLHESQLPYAEFKHGKGVGKWEKVVGKNGEVFYKIYGQAAQPFLYPALADNIDEIMDIAERGLDKAFRKK